jgi:cytochrome c556
MATRTLVAALLVAAAQQAPPRPAIPTATSALTAHLDQYTGTPVSVTARVAHIYGPTVFSIIQSNQKADAPDVLVVAAYLASPVQPGTTVTVIGDVVRFDAAAVAARLRDAAPPLATDVVDRYRDKAAIVAASVIDAAMSDLAKRPPPPMTPAEEAYSGVMKHVGPAFNSLRQAVTASNAADAAAKAAELKKLFGDALPFWKAEQRADALQWVDDAQQMAATIETAAARPDWDAVKADVPKLQQICSNCHNFYRERLDDGSYRYKRPK